MFSVSKRKYKRLLSALFAFGIFTVQAAAGVYADNLTVSYDSTTGAATTSYQNVTVEFEKAETYNVTLPKSVTLDVADETARLSYGVSATGEISTTHFVRVIPMSGAKVYNEDGSVALDLDVTLDKRRWNNVDVLTDSGTNDTTGVMSVDDIVPGKWTGILRFLVTLDDGGAWTPATCTSPAICTGYDDNDDGVISEDEKLGTPITKGKALGHTFAEGSNAFPDSCQRCKKMVYAISTPEQLTAFRDAVNVDGNTFAGATVELNADIDMSENPWDTGIGINDSKNFKGTFDGNGHTISNFTLTAEKTNSARMYGHSVGLFSYLYNTNTEIRNVTLVDSSVELIDIGTQSSSAYCEGLGAIVGCAEASTVLLDNVHTYNVNLKATDVYVYCSVGGLVGAAACDTAVTVNNCSVIGSAYGTTYSNNIASGRNSVFIGAVLGGTAFNATTVNGSTTLDVMNTLCSMSVTVGRTAFYATAPVVPCVTMAALTSCSVKNSIFDTDVCQTLVYLHNSQQDTAGAEPVYTNCMQSTTEDCQSQAAVDILNTDNTETWVLDLENVNNGYPLIR